MYILGIDTSHGYASVAISKDDNIIFHYKLLERNKQAEKISSLINNALKICNLDIRNIDYLAISNGPGSFTGIRIALSIGLGISIGSNIKTIMISNLETINYRIDEQVKEYDLKWVIIDAQRNELYTQSFTQANEASKAALVPVPEFIDFLLKSNDKIIISGSGCAKIYDAVSQMKNITILPRFPIPDSKIICKVAYQKIIKGDINDKIEPLYIRPPDAKI